MFEVSSSSPSGRRHIGQVSVEARELRAYWVRHASQNPCPQAVVRSGTAVRQMLHTSSAQVSSSAAARGVAAIAVGSVALMPCFDGLSTRGSAR